MDTRIDSVTLLSSALPSSSAPPSLFISPRELGRTLGRADAPLLLDVRPPARFDASTQMLATARRCAPESLPGLIAELTAAPAAIHPPPIVTYCVYGHQVSLQAAAQLRAAGLDARALAGGFEGGEDGVDDPQQITQWRSNASLKMTKRMDWGVPDPKPSRWVTRARPKIDRIACPWLIRRFVDPRAEFFYLPADQVLDEARRLNAVAYDAPGAPVSHVGESCSFEVLIAAFCLEHAALNKLSRMVCGADTDQLDRAPESAGLLAVSLGLSQLYPDDHAMLEAAMPIYDALYAWCQGGSSADSHVTPKQTHSSPPEAVARGKA